MARLLWDQVGERSFEIGVCQTVLYTHDTSKGLTPNVPGSSSVTTGLYAKATAWNGVSNITDSPGGAEPTDIYADNIKYASFRSAETYSGSVECYMYPDEFDECNGFAKMESGLKIGQQSRKAFGLSWRTEVGNDTADESDDSYKIHIVYGATASPSEMSHDTINDSPEPATMSFDLTTTPVAVPGFKPTAKVIIESKDYTKDQMTAIENILYGDSSTDARLPLPDEIDYILTQAKNP